MGKEKKTTEYFKNFFKLLKPDRVDIFQIYVLALISGIVYLTLPLGIQAVINIVITGVLTTSWYVLTGMVILGILVNGTLQIVQLKITENIRQRIFVRLSFDYAKKIFNINESVTRNKYLPEKINRIFDTFAIQKSLPKFLYEIFTSILQIILGLLLLSFYNTYFIFMGLFVLIVISIIIAISFKRAIRVGLEASTDKYNIIDYLIEFGKSRKSYRTAIHNNWFIEKTDSLMLKYLNKRKSFFKILIHQNIYLIVFNVVMTTVLLVFGGLLAIEGQINLGQFVSAEIVIILIIGSVDKLIKSLEAVFDLLISTEKALSIFELESTEKITEENDRAFSFPYYNLTIDHLEIKNEITNETIKIDNFKLFQNEKVVISGEINQVIDKIINILTGFEEEFTGNVRFNDYDIKKINGDNLLSKIAIIDNCEEVFQGSLTENLFYDGEIDSKFNELIEILNLRNFMNQINNFDEDVILRSGINLDNVTKLKLITLRALLKAPKFLIIVDNFGLFERKTKEKLINHIFNLNTSVLFFSNDIEVEKLSDKLIKFENNTFYQLK